MAGELGQIELRTFAALDQRFALRYAALGMTLEEAGQHIRQHLGLAGRTDALIGGDAIDLVHRVSRGYPAS